MKTRSWPLATFCFSLTFGVYILLAAAQDETSTAISGTSLTDWAIAVGCFVILFELMAIIYGTVIFSLINRSTYLSGVWYQVFIILGDSPIIERIRHGECQITTTLDSISFSANNLRIDGSFSSNWNSETAKIENKKLSLMFLSEGNRHSSRGTMNFNIQGNPPRTLIGNFNDSSPATHRGDIKIFKHKSDYLEWLKVLRE